MPNILVRRRQVCIVLFSRWPDAEGSPVNGRPFPSLIDVTTEQLNVGLESGQFTSVDLVNVPFSGSLPSPAGQYQ